MRTVKRLPSPRAMPRMIRKLHGVNRPHFNTEPLQREGSSVIAYVTGNDVRLDREHCE